MCVAFSDQNHFLHLGQQFFSHVGRFPVDLGRTITKKMIKGLAQEAYKSVYQKIIFFLIIQNMLLILKKEPSQWISSVLKLKGKKICFFL